MPVLPHEVLNLIDLPIDVLAFILQPLLTYPGRIPLCACRNGRVIPELSRELLSVLLIHPSLHAIASPIVYGANEFELDLTGHHGTHIRKSLETATTYLNSDNANRYVMGDYAEQRLRDMGLLRAFIISTARQKIQRLHIRLDKLRGWVQELLIPLISDMIVHGSLADFSVTVEYQPATRGLTLSTIRSQLVRDGSGGGITSHNSRNQKVPDDMSLFAKPPLAGILSVLADPYLRTARLWVIGSHGAAWCAFHDEVDCTRNPSSRMEIDWRGIVRQMGTDLAVAVD